MVADDGRLFVTADARREFVVAVALLALAVVGLAYFARAELAVLFDPEALREVVAATGPMAPLVFVVAVAAQIVLAPIPGHAVGFVGGYLFGTVAGSAYVVLGMAVGSAVAFWLSRRFGRPFVVRVFDASVVERFDAFVEEAGLWSLFVVFLVPGLPDDVVCFLGGLTDIDIRKLVVVATVGRAPSMVLTTATGSSVAAGELATAVGLLVALVVVAGLGYYTRDRWLGGRASETNDESGR
ncbi:MAG: TVP38/TMEM64 family protein [Haloarculaceae archaeon]